jgi:hypothetical protein
MLLEIDVCQVLALVHSGLAMGPVQLQSFVS